MLTKSYIKVFRILFAFYIITLFFLLLYSFNGINIEINRSFFGIPLDKIIHFTLFFPFSFFLYFTFGDKIKSKFQNYYILFILVVGLGIAATAEYSQLFTNYREFDYTDMTANMLSIIASSSIIYLTEKLISFRIKKRELEYENSYETV